MDKKKKMVKIICSITFIVLIMPLSLLAQVTFEKWYGGNDYDVGNFVVQTTDGGYIVAGATYSYGNSNSDAYLVKTDAAGNTLWTKVFGGDSSDIASSVQQTADGGYIITGTTWSFGAGKGDVWLIKTDSLGAMLWKKTFGSSDADSGYAVIQTIDGGYIITGFTKSFGAGNGDVYLIKTNSLGNPLYAKTYGGDSTDVGYFIQQTQDGGYIIVGKTRSYGAGDFDVWLIKTDANGDTLWTKTYGGENFDDGRSVQQTTDGGYIIAGSSFTYGYRYDDIYLVKTDAAGNTLWTKKFGGTYVDWGHSAAQTADGGYIVVGTTWSFGAGYGDVWLIKTAANGDSLWLKTYGGSHFEEGYCVAQTNDGGYIITGETNSYGTGSGDIYLIKTDADGNVGVEEKKNSDFGIRTLELKVHPNPFTKKTVINLSSDTGNSALGKSPMTNIQCPITISIYDVSGKLVYSLPSSVLSTHSSVMWNGIDNAGNQVENGVYFIRLDSKNYAIKKKIIFVK